MVVPFHTHLPINICEADYQAFAGHALAALHRRRGIR